jgi:hypothetical protein
LPELFDVGLEHVVAEHRAEVFDEVRKVVGPEQGGGLAIDLDDSDEIAACLHARRVLAQELAEPDDAGAAPFVEQRFDAAEILELERNRREIEHLGVIASLAA